MPQTFPVPPYPTCPAQPRLGRLALLVGLALSLSIGTWVQAATTWTVCVSGCPYTSIKAAIAAPTTLDGDTLAIVAGTYTEAGILVDKSLTLQGEDAASTIVQAATTRAAASDRVFTIASGVTVTLQELTIRYGHVDGNGGGIENAGTLTLSHCTVSGNGATFGGGLYNAGTLTLTHSTVQGNEATDWAYGGGLYNSYRGSATLVNSTVSGNAAYEGGGLYNDYNGTLTLTQSTVSGNTAGLCGGGLYNYGTLTLTNSTVSGNTAGLGGGLCTWGTLTLTHSTVRGNTATGNGGGLAGSGTLTLTHSTVGGNATDGAGGGLLMFSYGRLTLTHSTVSGNAADEGGGGIYNVYSTLTLTNSLVAHNPTGGDCHDYYRLIISQGYNLDSDGSCQLTAPTDRPGTDPWLGPLQDNGGSTFTQALLPGSPARDAIPWGINGCGTTLFSDQRWQARPQTAGGACDIGAYELEVAGQALEAWVAGFTPHSVTCNNITTGQVVTLSDPASPWDCEAAGLGVSSGNEVALHVRGPVQKGVTDVGGAVVGMAPSGGGCTNRTTGQQVKFQALFQGMPGATAVSCVAAGLGVHPGETVQMRVQGIAE